MRRIFSFPAMLSLAAAFLLLFFACRRDDDQPDPIEITTCDKLLIATGDTLQFEANALVDWQATAGSIDENGWYIAPDVQGKIFITATDKNDPARYAECQVLVSKHADLLKDMRQGGYVLYFRHTTATTGVDNFNSSQPQWWTSCDSTVARQLSPSGRVQAAEIGQSFNNINLPFSRIISSEFCRCVQTAELFDIKPVLAIETAQAVTFTVYGETDRYQRTIELINALPITSGLVLISAHSFPVGGPGPLLQMGDAAVYKQHPGGPAEEVAIITVGDWVALK